MRSASSVVRCNERNALLSTNPDCELEGLVSCSNISEDGIKTEMSSSALKKNLIP